MAINIISFSNNGGKITKKLSIIFDKMIRQVNIVFSAGVISQCITLLFKRSIFSIHFHVFGVEVQFYINVIKNITVMAIKEIRQNKQKHNMITRMK